MFQNLAVAPTGSKHGPAPRQQNVHLAGAWFAGRRGFWRMRALGLLVVLLAALHAGASWSANGMVAPGNGTTQLGMAGAGTAMAEDAAATLRNPAAGVWMGDAMTADLGLVVPVGGYEASAVGPASTIGLFEITPGRDTSVIGVFPSPAFARNWRLSDSQAWGLGVTAAGLKALSRATPPLWQEASPGSRRTVRAISAVATRFRERSIPRASAAVRALRWAST